MDDDRRDEPRFPTTDRPDAPLYLARYHERRARELVEDVETDDEDQPLYLRSFRRRTRTGDGPVWEGRDLAFAQSLSESNRTKEISAPPEAHRAVINEVYLVRHGETQGYSSESGLTPLGTWQAHTKGRDLAKRLRDGETVVVACAPTNRASETAENLHRGLVQGLTMFDKDVKAFEPRPMVEFRNFQVSTPSGLRDVTSAFREYYSLLEEYERVALGDRPMWLVEIDRFWRTQQGGGDPIQHWLTVPMMHFEPPAMCVRRFWRGIQALSAEHPGARLVICTHSGPIRAFAIWAFGYDPGEPYNVEHVRVRLFEEGDAALVGYRNRVQEVHIPALDELPIWEET